MKYVLMMFFLLISCVAFAQKQHRSRKYHYSIEIPRGFVSQSATFSSIDVKAADKFGNSVTVNVKPLDVSITPKKMVQEMNSVSDQDYTQLLSEYSNNVRIIKRGASQSIPGLPYYTHYTFEGLNGGSQMYTMTYNYVGKGLLYVVSGHCSADEIDHYAPVFMRYIKSFARTN